ncbi:asparagine synthase (glutamine-hydrolyzing) [Haloferula sp. BvORR071]|uniref:asparagine synthase (glutamine-hydrolyzing) n=1 Tax=Haloferula sp. BvORR071 TaxID=1396141 RepID=UPI0005591170|nr:asparagine synthase (glutamine-hydrolyzing) [Haloferula sp. BvORR071]
MCGIAGWFGQSSFGDAEKLKQGLQNRGPDGSGVWQGKLATMIHTRLSILDLSDAAGQPMSWAPEARGRSYVMVFNGEIYNFRELRQQLEKQGETFHSNGDSEVLLRLLVKEGAACIPKLAGMFAFAFWDEASGEALLARDAYGIKPLYVREEPGEPLAFASEVRVLQKSDDEVDHEALRDYFLWGSVQEPRTLHAAIRSLPAGHLLRWKDGKSTVSRWHQPGPSANTARTRHEAATITRQALEESVARHLVSDVPVGIFLSGGIDSTVVLALARQILGKDADIRTFSIGFDDPEFDESSLAKRTAEHFRTSHTEWRMTAEEGAAEIPRFLESMDQPGIDGFNTWCVSKLARREGMKVVLSGLGGDEFFGGYRSFERVPRFRNFHRMSGPLRSAFAGRLERAAPGSPWRRLGEFLRSEGSWQGAYHVQRGIFTQKEAIELTRALTGFEAGKATFGGIPDSLAGREAVGWLETTYYMRNQLLRDSDIYSMAHGLELRVPLVDDRLAKAVATIPQRERLRRGKGLLLDAVPEIPDWIRQQPKRGFRFPFQRWVEGSFGDLLQRSQKASPVPLGTWYRTWAVAAARKSLGLEASR